LGEYTYKHRQQGDLISLLYFFFQNKESTLITERLIQAWFKFLYLKRKDHLGDLIADEMKIINWLFKQNDVRVCTGFNWLTTGPSIELP
jgi:hypothetical protein